ncbi:hypothetical protein C8R42DRAFT_640798 [Lentinula raphanica]|nr:hypothetical protein C8R42DRAFT_640798 [Lentinula raphanica]
MSVEPPAPAAAAASSVSPSQPLPPAPPFFLQSLSEVSTDVENQLFTITRRGNANPLEVSFEEMIECVLASLAIGRRWKMVQGAPPRYEEIVKTLFAYIPSTSPANFSIMADGNVEKTESPVTYECIFSPEQLKILIKIDAISGNVFTDVKKAYPKPARASTFAGSRNEKMHKLIDMYNFDQDVLMGSMHEVLLKQHKQKMWRATRPKQAKSVRGVERYATSDAGSSTMGLAEKMRMWNFRSNPDEDSTMDGASEAGGPSGN